jgi:hypothetical protein
MVTLARHLFREMIGFWVQSSASAGLAFFNRSRNKCCFH